jgi:chorismate synthase
MLRFVTAGESHGICLTGVIEGLPAGLAVDISFINDQLQRRQKGYGRGGRMKIEHDVLQITSGVRHGLTMGSPIAFSIQNKDWENWRIPMAVEPVGPGSEVRAVTHPRPGHGDLAGALKYQTHDMRNVLERASARETAARVAVGALCSLLLARFGLRIASHTLAIGQECVAKEFENLDVEKALAIDPKSPLHCADSDAEQRMITAIDVAERAGDTVGSIVEVVAGPMFPGLGSHTQWDRRIDGLIAQAMMSIPAVKAVEIGEGIAAARKAGSAVHDEIYYDPSKRRFFRSSNNAGGIEGGISNGEQIRVKIYLKPIPTLRNALSSVDISTRQTARAVIERSDICVGPAAGVVAESMLAFVLAREFLQKFGGDSLQEVEHNFAGYTRMLDAY